MNPLKVLAAWPAMNPDTHDIPMNREQHKLLQRLSDLRPEVLAFALAMEKKLKANDHKGGWKNDDPDVLLGRCKQELEELRLEIRIELNTHRVWIANGGPSSEQYKASLPALLDRICNEAADVGNFAMMVADTAGALKLVDEGIQPGVHSPDALP